MESVEEEQSEQQIEEVKAELPKEFSIEHLLEKTLSPLLDSSEFKMAVQIGDSCHKGDIQMFSILKKKLNQDASLAVVA